ncbi:MAG: flippase-like domain-containing protein [Actinobacteria bacterium]|nr:flippase-like domain-containing protein [Actinomycetota bacterium]
MKQFYAKHKKKISTTLRILISAGLIAYLIIFRSGFKDFNNFVDILKTINIPLLIASASIHIFGIWISAFRWQILLKTQDIRISQGYLSSSFLIGTFFNNLLPTSIGGDIYRTIDIANKEKISIGKSASVIVVERFSGVISAATYAIIALFLGFRTVGKTSYVIPVIVFFAVCIILLFIILNPSILRLNKVVDRIKFLSRTREKLREIYHTFMSFKKYKLALISVLICSFALQFGVIGNYWLAARSLGINLSFESFIFIVPIVATIAMLPISIGGTGIRENSLVFLMVALGAPSDKSTVCSLILFAMLIVLGIIGAVVYIVRPLFMKQPRIPKDKLKE